MLEVGPGLGFLSVELARLGVELLAVEIDTRLAPLARASLDGFPACEVFEGDVLAGKNALNQEVTERLPTDRPWHLVANLPYGVAGPLLILLARLAHAPASITVLVQRELAERLAAEPGGAAWGGLSAKLRATYDARILRSVPPGLFWPRPRVHSAVVRLEWRGPAGVDLAAFDGLVDGLFRNRRKALRAGLGAHLGDSERVGRLLGGLGLDGTSRAENFSPQLLMSLLEAIQSDSGP